MFLVRRATWNDKDDIYRLACTGDVRAASFSSNKIEQEEHLEWYQRVLASKNEFIFVLTVDDKFSGQIRYTVGPDNRAKVGISLTQEARGKHYAIQFLTESLLRLRAEKPSVKAIIAEIKTINTSSQKFFKKAGFQYRREVLINNTPAQQWELPLSRVFVIAELSANHNQDMDVAKRTILAIKESGADAVKIQTYTADTMTIDCRNKYFTLDQGTVWDGRTFYDLYKEAYTPWEWHDDLRDYAQSLGLVFFSTPFDKTAVDFLESKCVPIYKIASFEITDIPLLEYTASKGKPMIISTGIATAQDIEDAVSACRSVGNNDITLLKCTSSYPAPIEEANLLTMVDMKQKFDVKVGLSDHSLGSDVALAAVALGAEVIEKHVILDRKQGGPDAGFSMEPQEFRAMVDSIRNVEKALGVVTYELSDKAFKNREFARSLFVVEDIKAGEIITENNVRAIRPGFGLAPKHFKEVLGKKVTRGIERGTPLAFDQMID